MNIEELLERLQEMSCEELAEDIPEKERANRITYHGSISLQSSGQFYGVRLDGENVPEGSVFIDDLIMEAFALRLGRWSEPGDNKFRITIERLD